MSKATTGRGHPARPAERHGEDQGARVPTIPPAAEPTGTGLPFNLSVADLIGALGKTGEGLLIRDAAGRRIWCNDQAAGHFGFTSAEAFLRVIPEDAQDRYDLFNEEGRPLDPTALPGPRAAAGEHPPPVLLRLRDSSGRQGWSEVRARPLVGPDGVVLGALSVTRDVTQEQQLFQALRESQRRLSFLAKTGAALLDASVDHRGILERVMDQVVPELADYSTLREVLPDGTLRRLAVRHADPAKAELVSRLLSFQSAETPASLLAVLETGQSLLTPEVPQQAVMAAAQNDEHLRLLTELDARSALMVAIPARGRIVAIISLILAGSERRYGEADQLLVEDLARRAGLAIDNARLYEAEHRSLADAEAARAEAESATGALSLLLDASTILTGSPHFDEGLARLGRLVLSTLCDVCLVDLLDPDGSPRRVVAEVADPNLRHLAGRLLHEFGPTRGGLHASARVMRSGVAEIIPDLAIGAGGHPPEPPLGAGEPRVAEASTDPARRALTTALGGLSLLCVPLTARRGVLGALTLVSTTYSGRRYREADLRLAEHLAHRAGLALDNARLLGERSRIATILQQSLLPPELPAIAGFELAGRYRPAVGDIGGDFYDVFALGRRRWLLAVGDVCGKGPEAAWLTSMVRYTLRAAAMQAKRPSRMLSLVNAAMLRQAPKFQFCTLACAVLTVGKGGGTLTVALGGHPHPLLRNSRGAGPIIRIGAEGDLLGVLEDPHFEDQTIALGPGDAAAFFTDGALQSGGPGTEDDHALHAALARAGDLDADALAGALEATVSEHRADRPPDDLLVLVVKVPPAPPR